MLSAETLAWTLAAPFLALAFLFCAWTGVIMMDIITARFRVWQYSRNIRRCPPLTTLEERQLCNLLWEAHWLLRHSGGRGYLAGEDLRGWYSQVNEQMKLYELSQEAYHMWLRASLCDRID